MMDLSDKGSECEDTSSPTLTPDRLSSDGSNNLKTCVDCGTSKTPLWRGGPAGPKSLCNACGIRSRKKRRALMGITKDENKTKKSTAKIASQQSNSGGNSCTSSIGDSTFKIRDAFNRKLWAFGQDVAMQRPRSKNTTRRRKFGREEERSKNTMRRRNLGWEEEQAAILLMALSCGSVYA